MKEKLIIQSLSPLALFTVIKNCSFITADGAGNHLSTDDFLNVNLPILIVVTVCLIWLALSIVFLMSFGIFKYSGRTSGYGIDRIEEKGSASLDLGESQILCKVQIVE